MNRCRGRSRRLRRQAAKTSRPHDPARDGSTPFQGATVSPVDHERQGLPAGRNRRPGTDVTRRRGQGHVTFTHEPGWHRIKATVGHAGSGNRVRSNRLDVCVPAGRRDRWKAPAEDRRELPAGDGAQVRRRRPAATSDGPETSSGRLRSRPRRLPRDGRPGRRRATSPARCGSRRRRSTARSSPQGRLGVSWKVLDAGPGVRQLDDLLADARREEAPLGDPGERRHDDRGDDRGCRSGHAYRLRFAITDAAGKTSTSTLGKVVVPGGRAAAEPPTTDAAAVAIAGAGRVARGAGGGAGARRGDAEPEPRAQIDATVRFLQESQSTDGGFGANRAATPSQTSAPGSRWRSPPPASTRTTRRAAAAPSAYAYLGHFGDGSKKNAWPQSTTAFERELLVVDATGTDPHDFAGHDLVAEILGRQLPDGSFPHEAGRRTRRNRTTRSSPSWRSARSTSRRSKRRSRRRPNGSSRHRTQTAAGLLLAARALTSRQRSRHDRRGDRGAGRRRRCRTASRSRQRSGRSPTCTQRSFPTAASRRCRGEGESNVASTAWAVQGIWAAGGNPEAWTTGPAESANRSTTWTRCSSPTATSASGRAAT